MKRLSLMVFAASMAITTAQAGQKGNGGDICEQRFQSVRDDIASWIATGGSEGLDLPSGVKLDRYNGEMLSQIKNAQVSCTTDKIFVGGAEKTCKNFDQPGGGSRIVCNDRRFMETPESDQYVLVHHEYAGLAGFEANVSDDSRYPISTQISGYLENQLVKRLVVKPSVFRQALAVYDCEFGLAEGHKLSVVATQIEDTTLVLGADALSQVKFRVKAGAGRVSQGELLAEGRVFPYSCTRARSSYALKNSRGSFFRVTGPLDESSSLSSACFIGDVKAMSKELAADIKGEVQALSPDILRYSASVRTCAKSQGLYDSYSCIAYAEQTATGYLESCSLRESQAGAPSPAQDVNPTESTPPLPAPRACGAQGDFVRNENECCAGLVAEQATNDSYVCEQNPTSVGLITGNSR